MRLEAQVIGRLGHDPSERETKNGDLFVVMSVAASLYRGKQKEKETVWVDVTIWNEHTARFIKDYAKKGDMVCVTGEPTARAYKSKAGEPKASLQITVGRFDGDVVLFSAPQGQSESTHEGDEEIPF